jgi:hypothetical protein
MENAFFMVLSPGMNLFLFLVSAVHVTEGCPLMSCASANSPGMAQVTGKTGKTPIVDPGPRF